MNLPGSRGGWTSHGGSKNQLGPDKQHRQSGMLSSGKKSDQSKMPLSKLMWQHRFSCHTTVQLWFNYSLYQNSALYTSEQHWSTVICWPGTFVSRMFYLWAQFLYEIFRAAFALFNIWSWNEDLTTMFLSSDKIVDCCHIQGVSRL